VLHFTPEVESALRWFHWTHTLTLIPMVGVRYVRTSWPAAGGAGEQDAWLTSALDVLCDVHNDILIEQGPKRPTKKKRDRRRG
jgi:hypothetical protein